jgi:hypothetical protein
LDGALVIAGIRFGFWCRVGLSDGAVLYGRGVGYISGWPGEGGGDQSGRMGGGGGVVSRFIKAVTGDAGRIYADYGIRLVENSGEAWVWVAAVLVLNLEW